MILVPAYGRDYKSAAEVKRDWEADKDFKISDISMGRWNGSYVNKSQFDRDVPESQRKGSYIRYFRLTMITFVDVWDEQDKDEE